MNISHININNVEDLINEKIVIYIYIIKKKEILFFIKKFNEFLYFNNTILGKQRRTTILLSQ